MSNLRADLAVLSIPKSTAERRSTPAHPLRDYIMTGFFRLSNMFISALRMSFFFFRISIPNANTNGIKYLTYVRPLFYSQGDYASKSFFELE